MFGEKLQQPALCVLLSGAGAFGCSSQPGCRFGDARDEVTGVVIGHMLIEVAKALVLESGDRVQTNASSRELINNAAEELLAGRV